ncbi:MAG: hypothetical protein LBN29_00650 [Mediterranea sp.]|nr:hypothetical protein [Mediterranea sp.]
MIKVKKINEPVSDAAALPALLDKEGVGFEPIANVNWAEYPYRPEVKFRVAHTDDAILLHYQVKEASVRARYATDNAPVWTDSCVEFFSIPASDGIYYNLECNCAGTVLLAAGPAREGREQAPPEATSLIRRWASLGHAPFEERVADTTWEVALIIPYKAFFKHHIESLDGQTLRANFYKCGDELRTPHFLSWNPIGTATPDFHRPEFFGELRFER